MFYKYIQFLSETLLKLDSDQHTWIYLMNRGQTTVGLGNLN